MHFYQVVSPGRTVPFQMVRRSRLSKELKVTFPPDSKNIDKALLFGSIFMLVSPNMM